MSEELVPVEIIEKKIFMIRGQKVMLDRDLAELYGVKTGSLNRQVQRNIGRFPEDFMFRLTVEEYDNLMCQIGTSSLRPQIATLKTDGIEENLRCQIGTAKSENLSNSKRRFLPFAFTQEGLAMLSSVLRSPRAVQVNIAIMRAFVKFRQMMSGNDEIIKKLNLLEKRSFKHDGDIRQLFRDIRKMTIEKSTKIGKVGFIK
jgi:hypothetical protein